MKPTGIYDKWKKLPLKYSKMVLEQASNVCAAETELKEYIESGNLGFSGRPPPNVLPKYQGWESTYLEVALSVLGSHIQQKQELACFMEGNPLSLNTMGNSFLYVYYSQLVIQHIYALQKKRFGRRGDGKVSMHVVPFIAMGFLAGKADEATKASLLLLKIYSRGEFTHQEYPIYCFILRIIAEFLNQPPLVLAGKALSVALYDDLYREWKNPDINVITELCLAACDYHTHQCKQDKDNEWYEFRDLTWSFWPIEINLLFKLRQMVGLKNPVVDHPLMNTPLGELPMDEEFVLDDLARRVFEKMRGQGFDEGEVYERIYTEQF